MKPLIEYLDLGDGRYIENDIVKSVHTEYPKETYLTWEECWAGIKADMLKIQNEYPLFSPMI